MQTDNVKQILTEVVKVTSQEGNKDEGKLKLLVFLLDDEEYAVDITELQEIIPMSEITPVPNSPEFIKGILNLRGSIIVIIDLEKRFHLDRKKVVKQEHIVVTEMNDGKFGISVDKVKEILKISSEDIQETPDLVSTKIKADYLKGVLVLGKGDVKGDNESRLVIFLDLKKLLEEEELLSVEETLKKIKTNPKTV